MTTLDSWDSLADGAQDSKEPSIAPKPFATHEQDTLVPAKGLGYVTHIHGSNCQYFTGMQEESGKKQDRT